MILNRTLTFENQNLKRCKIESEIAYESKKDEFRVYKKRQRASGYHPCREPDDLTSCSGSLTSEEGSQLGSYKSAPSVSKSSRGRTRAVPSRFNDTVLDAWRTRRRKHEYSNSSYDDDVYLEKKDECNGKRVKFGTPKFHPS
ncbi:PREDICTED: histone-lysine N-methyltransferase ATX3-like, partial [Tarenaya hassleriana]